jgi:hypothetical protein
VGCGLLHAAANKPIKVERPLKERRSGKAAQKAMQQAPTNEKPPAQCLPDQFFLVMRDNPTF